MAKHWEVGSGLETLMKVAQLSPQQGPDWQSNSELPATLAAGIFPCARAAPEWLVTEDNCMVKNPWRRRSAAADAEIASCPGVQQVVNQKLGGDGNRSVGRMNSLGSAESTVIQAMRSLGYQANARMLESPNETEPPEAILRRLCMSNVCDGMSNQSAVDHLGGAEIINNLARALADTWQSQHARTCSPAGDSWRAGHAPSSKLLPAGVAHGQLNLDLAAALHAEFFNHVGDLFGDMPSDSPCAISSLPAGQVYPVPGDAGEVTSAGITASESGVCHLAVPPGNERFARPMSCMQPSLDDLQTRMHSGTTSMGTQPTADSHVAEPEVGCFQGDDTVGGVPWSEWGDFPDLDGIGGEIPANDSALFPVPTFPEEGALDELDWPEVGLLGEGWGGGYPPPQADREEEEIATPASKCKPDGAQISLPAVHQSQLTVPEAREASEAVSGSVRSVRMSSLPGASSAAVVSAIHGVRTATVAGRASMAAAAEEATAAAKRGAHSLRSRINTVAKTVRATERSTATSAGVSPTLPQRSKGAHSEALDSSCKATGSTAPKKRKSREAVWKQAHLCIPADPLYQHLRASKGTHQTELSETSQGSHSGGQLDCKRQRMAPSLFVPERLHLKVPTNEAVAANENVATPQMPSLEQQLLELAQEWKGHAIVRCLDLGSIKSTVVDTPTWASSSAGWH